MAKVIKHPEADIAKARAALRTKKIDDLVDAVKTLAEPDSIIHRIITGATSVSPTLDGDEAISHAADVMISVCDGDLDVALARAVELERVRPEADFSAKVRKEIERRRDESAA